MVQIRNYLNPGRLPDHIARPAEAKVGAAAVDPLALAREIRRHCTAREISLRQFAKMIEYPNIIEVLERGCVPRPATYQRIRARLDRVVL